MDLIQVNITEDNKRYYDTRYNVFLWCGCGYVLQGFDVLANNIEEALENVVTYCDNNNLQEYLIEVEEIYKLQEELQEELDDQYLYIDATIGGASKPYFIYSSELRIEEVKKD